MKKLKVLFSVLALTVASTGFYCRQEGVGGWLGHHQLCGRFL